MSKSKFTSGPWKVGEGKLRRFSIHQDVGPSAGGRYIGTTTANHPERMPRSILEEDAANALLMADAPKMLEVIRSLVKSHTAGDETDYDDQIQSLKAGFQILERHGG